MGAVKRPKLRRGQLASGEEYFYSRRPSTSRTKLKLVAKAPSRTRAKGETDRETPRSRKKA